MSRLLPVLALTGALVGLPATSASADLTVPTALPSPLPTTSLPVEEPVPTVEVPTLAVTEPITAAISEPAPGPTAAGTADTSSPKFSPPPAPALPALPALPGVTLPGGSQSPPSSGGSGGDNGSGGTSARSPLGDDVLPAALEDELCTVLTTLLGPLPEQIKGLPRTVIDELPTQITDIVPADVLATVTLTCPTPAPGAAAPAGVQQVQQVKAPKTRTAPQATSGRVTPAGLASLPHTGIVAGVPVLGTVLLLLGLVLRRRARA